MSPGKSYNLFFIVYSCRSHHQLSVDVWIFKIRSQIRILQAFLCQKIVKNEAQKAKKTNRSPTIIWEVRVHIFVFKESVYKEPVHSKNMFPYFCISPAPLNIKCYHSIQLILSTKPRTMYTLNGQNLTVVYNSCKPGKTRCFSNK